LQEHLRTSAKAAPGRLARLIADLDADSFDAREKASEELGKLGQVAEPALRGILEGKPSLEVRRRAEQLLARLGGNETTPDSLRIIRAVEALELLGTPLARRVLADLARGEAETPLTREANATLKRLAKRTASAP
jgi:hypothetical protein